MNTRANQQPLRVGLIGSGKMGLNHLRAMNALQGVKVVGVADPAADRDVLAGLLPPDAAIVASAEDLLTQASPQVVHIVTPPHTHTALALTALRHGAHAYIEKPFALTTTETRTILELATERALRVCAGHQCLFDHPSAVGRHHLAELGPIVHIESYFSFRQVRRGISPVDQAKDILPHAVYMLLDYIRVATQTDLPAQMIGLETRADGSVYALLDIGGCIGVLIVTLTGRPVEQYLHVVGRNGSMRVDLVSGAVVRLAGPGTSAVSAMLNPFRQAMQISVGSAKGFARRIRDRKKGYPGLPQLFRAFYDEVEGAPQPAMTHAAILETVTVCETIGRRLDEDEQRAQHAAQLSLESRDRALPPADSTHGRTLVTGAAGFLGAEIVSELRRAGIPVVGLSRRPVRYSDRQPGVIYAEGDLAGKLPAEIFGGVATVVHAAAETRGGKADHERNSIRATDAILTAAAQAGVKRFVHISSIAVLTPAASGASPVDESAPVDVDNLARGPYVWGKAESERVVQARGTELGIDVRIIRLGPLVNFADFEPPGRLGRELGPIFVAIGPKKSRIFLCDVATAAQVIRLYVESFAEAPPRLNLVEPDPPTRADLIARLRRKRPDLRVFWLPMFVLRVLSPLLKLAQRVALGSKQPIDVASAFDAPKYNAELARDVLQRARPRSTEPVERVLH